MHTVLLKLVPEIASDFRKSVNIFIVNYQCESEFLVVRKRTCRNQHKGLTNAQILIILPILHEFITITIMLQNFRSIAPLLLGISLLMLGNGSLPTVLATRLTTAGEPVWLTGFIMSQYYTGFVLGTVFGHKLIFSIGHIRAFAAFGTVMSAATLIHSFILDPWVWALLRLLVGGCAVGMFICVESWLNTETENRIRGQIFSLYTLTVYLFGGVGQFLVQIPDGTGYVLFVLISILMSLSIIPVVLTRVTPPPLEKIERFNFLRLWQTSPTGMAVSGISGLILGAFYALGPVFAQFSGLDLPNISVFMGVVMIGGMAIQWPIGKYSDGRDRRKVLLYTTFVLACISVLLSISMITGWLLIGFTVMFAGLSSVLYPLAAAYTNDYLDSEDVVPASAGLVMSFGIGAILGPLISALAIAQFGGGGLFVFCAIASSVAVCLIVWRIRQREIPDVKDQVEFLLMSRTSPVIAQLDPRGKPMGDGE